MDIVLGVSMAPTTVRLVLVEGEDADGVTVDEEGLELEPVGTPVSPTAAAEQTVAAILGTREGAADGNYHVASIGVTWTDPVQAAALRDALACHKVENVMLVSSFMAAAALAQAVGNAIGYARTGLLFLEPDTVTLAVVDSADGSIVGVQRQPMRNADTPVQMVSALTALSARPDGLFVVGSGVDVTAVKPRLETATPLPVSAPAEPESALARGAALASANTPLFTSSTFAIAYAQDPDPEWTTTQLVDPYAGARGADFSYADGHFVEQSLAYSQVSADGDDFTAAGAQSADRAEPARKPFLVALSVMMMFVVGAVALAVALAVSVHPVAGEQPNPNASLVAPAKQVPAPAPKVAAQPPAAPPQSAPQPAPEVPAAPAPASEAPAAEAPAPQAPAPASAEPPAAAVPAAVPDPEAPAPARVAPVPAASAPEAPAPAAAAPAPAAVPAPAPAPAAPVPAAPAPAPAAPAPVPAAPAPPPVIPVRIPVPIIMPVAPVHPYTPAPVFSPPSQQFPSIPGGANRGGGGMSPGGATSTNPGLGGTGTGGFGGNPGGSAGHPGGFGGNSGGFGGHSGGSGGNPGGFGGNSGGFGGSSGANRGGFGR